MSDILRVKQALPAYTIENRRLYDYNQQKVWNAIANANHLKRWWGPNGFTNVFHSFDLKVGGYWRFTMHGPDGKDYANESRFVQITMPSFIVFDHISPPKFQVQISLDAIGEQHTEFCFKMVFDTEKEQENIVGFAKPKNEENLDRLGALLAELYSS